MCAHLSTISYETPDRQEDSGHRDYYPNCYSCENTLERGGQGLDRGEKREEGRDYFFQALIPHPNSPPPIQT